MHKEHEEKTALDKVADSLSLFWKKRSPQAQVKKTPHATLVIEPKVFIGGELNPEISKLIVKEYLSTFSLREVLRGEVLIAPQAIIIRDRQGKPLVKVKSASMIASMQNQVTQALGCALASQTDKTGAPFIEDKRTYNFYDIRDSLIKFMKEQNKLDSKNLFREACVLLLAPKN